MKYDKLVRDKIPNLIRKDGESPVTHIADSDEYWRKLKNKLQEEIKEFSESESEQELVDIFEVLYAICKFKNLDTGRIESLRKKKAKEKGEFKGRIVLDEIK